MPIEGWGRAIAGAALSGGLCLAVPAGAMAADLPSAPLVGVAGTAAGGLVTLPVNAAPGATVRVQEDDTVVATGYGVGAVQTLSFHATTGVHRYTVTTTDAYGVTSAPTRVRVAADATPPTVRGLRLTTGSAEDARTRLTLATEPGTDYTLTVDGLPVARGTTAPGRPLDLVRPLPDGAHLLSLLLVDEAGNQRVLTRQVAVAVPRLDVAARLVSTPGDATQVVQVEGTPGATARVTVSGHGTRSVRLAGGTGRAAFTLDDGRYDGARVWLADDAGRRGSTRLAPFAVDTAAPRLLVDSQGGGEVPWEARVVAEPGSRVSWQLVDAAGVAVLSARFVADGTDRRLGSDLDAGDYELRVTATDPAGNRTSRSSSVDVAAGGITAGDAVAAGGSLLVLVVALGLLSLLVSAQRQRVAARRELRAQQAHEREEARLVEAAALAHAEAVAAYQERLVDHEAALLLHDEHVAGWEQRRAQLADLVERARLDRGMRPPAGFTALKLRPWEQIYCTVPGSMVELRNRQGGTHVAVVDDGDVTVTSERVVFSGFKRREWLLGQLEGIEHSGTDRTMMKVSARKNWSGVTYADPGHTRLAIALAAADHMGSRDAVVALAEADLLAHDDARPTPPAHPGPPPQPPVGTSPRRDTGHRPARPAVERTLEDAGGPS